LPPERFAHASPGWGRHLVQADFEMHPAAP
jgi:hypothetical protein